MFVKTIIKKLKILLPQLYKRKFFDGMIVYGELCTYTVEKGYFSKNSHMFMYCLRVINSPKLLSGSELHISASYAEKKLKISIMPIYNSVWNKINGT